ncbi:MAG: hypothetical protein P1V35_04030 [Planctomycetota bacterium]|nr:hypothetical protein [Planctomycetota bacterium]
MNSDSNPNPFDEEFLERAALELALQTSTVEDLLAEQSVDDRQVLAERLKELAFQVRVQEMQMWVGETREQLVDWKGLEDAQAAALSPKILEASTRKHGALDGADPVPQGVLGDAKILMGFLRRRLSSSVALRLAAASLIAHLIALPALAAYIYWVQPKDSNYTLRMDPTRPALPEEIVEVAPEEILEEDVNLWSALGLQADNAIAGAKYELSHGDFQGLATGLAEPWSDWVQVRLHRLQRGAQRMGIGEIPEQAPLSLGHVLAFDMALDDWLLGRGSAGFPAGWIQGLLALVEAGDAGQGDLSRLAGAALYRAKDYGLLPDLPLERPDGSGWPRTAEDPLGEAWLECMGRLKAGPESDFPFWNAWFEEQR